LFIYRRQGYRAMTNCQLQVAFIFVIGSAGGQENAWAARAQGFPFLATPAAIIVA
jgi:hypothetical protein